MECIMFFLIIALLVLMLIAQTRIELRLDRLEAAMQHKHAANDDNKDNKDNEDINVDHCPLCDSKLRACWNGCRVCTNVNCDCNNLPGEG